MSVSLDTSVIYSTNDWLSRFAFSRNCTKIRGRTSVSGLSVQMSGVIYHIALVASAIFCSMSSFVLLASLGLFLICAKSDLREFLAVDPSVDVLIQEMRRRALAS
jgi:hypothetical protein